VGEAYYAPLLASLDEQARLREIEEISTTAEWAIDIGTRALVIHTGKIEDDELRSMCLEFKDGVRDGMGKKYRHDLFEEIVRRREREGLPYLESIIDSLDLLCSRFPDLNFFIETRVHYYEIPLPDELEKILKTLPYPNLGYWNDIGHTHMLDILGYVPMQTWQDRFSARCGGTHIHDMDAELLDHYPPGEGVLDIHGILEQFDSDVLLTLEINARHDYESVIRGIRHLRADRICV
jgi:sugar phosphate isomerase/epimerase